MDFLQFLRLQNLFNPSQMDNSMNPNPISMGPESIPSNQPIQSNSPARFTPPNQVDDIEGMLSRLYTPEHNMQDRLMGLMNNYPTEAPVSTGRRIGASAVGALTDIGRMFGGVGNGEQAYDDITGKTKFREDLFNWKNKVEPTERLATLEKQNNTNERTMAMQTISAKLREEAEQHRVEKNDKDYQIKQQRADAYDFKVRNPLMKIVIPKGGNIMAMDPVTGQLHDTGIDSGSLSDADKAALTQENKLEQIDVNQKNTEKNINTKHENTLDEIGARAKEARTTKSTPSGNAPNANKPELPTQTRVRQLNKARELYNSRPDLRPFIKITGNEFQITPPGSGGMFDSAGPNPAQYKELNDAIYGSTPPAPTSSHGVTNQPTNQPKAPVAPKGWKYVPKPGGGWTAVKDNGGV